MRSVRASSSKVIHFIHFIHLIRHSLALDNDGRRTTMTDAFFPTKRIDVVIATDDRDDDDAIAGTGVIARSC